MPTPFTRFDMTAKVAIAAGRNVVVHRGMMPRNGAARLRVATLPARSSTVLGAMARTAKGRDPAGQRRKSAPLRWNDPILGQEEQFARRRQALLLEAGRAFNKRGFHETSLDDVARALNVTKPALYYYFKDKHEILYECHRTAMDLCDRVREAADRDGGTGAERLRRHLIGYVEGLTDALGACHVLTEHNALRLEDRARIQKRRRAFDTWLRGLVLQGIADGSIAPCEPKLAVFFFMGAVNAIQRWFETGGAFSGRQVAEAYADLLFRGLAPRPG